MAQDAVVRNIEILGEAAKRVSESTRALRPAVPWRQMAGMRDVLIHQYDRVALDEVWRVVQDAALPLQSAVETLIAELSRVAGD